MTGVAGRRRRLPRMLPRILFFGLAASPVAAQSVLRGIVLTEGGDPIRDAQVTIGKLQLQTAVGHVGDFSFTTIPSGKFSVLARAIGFEPMVREFRFSGRDTILAEFRLKASAQRLDSLVVRGTETTVSPGMRAFEERRAAGLGRFLTSADLRKREHSALSDVLRMTAGLKLVRRPQDCGGGYALATGRGGAVFWQPDGLPWRLSVRVGLLRVRLSRWHQGVVRRKQRTAERGRFPRCFPSGYRTLSRAVRIADPVSGDRIGLWGGSDLEQDGGTVGGGGNATFIGGPDILPQRPFKPTLILL